MVLSDKVLDILNDMESIETVIYDSGFSANVRLDRKATPAAILYLMTDWELDISKGVLKESADMEVFFCKRAEHDIKGEDKDIIVTETYELAKEFLGLLLEDKTITVVDDSIKMRATYGKFDSFVVGCSLHIKIEERQGSCL